MRLFKFTGLFLFVFLYGFSLAQKMPPSLEESKNEPIKYTGKIQTEKKYYDGSLPHAVGVHHYQVFRSNRSYPSEPGVNGWTYNHQPYLAYWNDQFYMQFLQGEVQEHTPPTRILMTTSKNGEEWARPVIAFPEYELPDIRIDDEFVPAGTKAVMHQRMGWYVAPNSKLLISGFYSYCPTPRRSPNAGTGLGRVIREVKKDGSFGPIYFIRYNRHAGWNESNTTFPFYKESKDKAFLQACDALLADKLISLQWWEEDRGQDGFYTIDPSKVPGGDVFHRKITTAKGAGKAFNFYERPDGIIVGVWKNQFAAMTADRGKTWTDIQKDTTLWTTGAKTWAQKTEDGRYAIVHNQSATMRNRFPMAVLVGEDGYEFDRLYCLRGEMPARRYQGLHKNPGAQYFRGIIPGNGNPPGEEMWNTYSMNKEDIWVSSTRVPVTASVSDELKEDFNSYSKASDMDLWNLYFSAWAKPYISRENGNTFLKLVDEEPYDYAYAERIFPAGSKKQIAFRFRAPELPQGASCEIEFQDQRNRRALRLRIDKDWLSFDIEKVGYDAVKINPQIWNRINLAVDCEKGSYTVKVNDKMVEGEIPLNDAPENIERIVLRTGPFRGYVPAEHVETGIGRQSGFYSEDLPGADVKAPKIEFDIDDLVTKGE
jgi:Sialidase-like, CBM domain